MNNHCNTIIIKWDDNIDKINRKPYFNLCSDRLAFSINLKNTICELYEQ